MTHARTTSPAASPVQAVITNHRAAYDAFQVAPDGMASQRAAERYDEASMTIASVFCGTPAEAAALFRHLVWWLGEEAQFSDGHEPAYGIALARAKDLSLFLAATTQPRLIPQAMPSGRLAARLPRRPVPLIDLRSRTAIDAPRDEALPGEVEPWEAVAPARPDTAHVRAPRFMELAGEALTAVAIIAGGVFAYGFLPIA